MIPKLILRNLVYKSYITVLSLVLLCIGTGITSVLLLMEQQISKKFAADLQDIDMVIGAKGSPMQLILSAVYHLEAPTGNIHLSEVQSILNSPLIEEAIPLAYGDSYKGFRILGSDDRYIKKYKATYKAGSIFKKDMETVIGNAVADKLGLKMGSEFFGNHGLSEHGESHEDHMYKVVGILNSTGTVLDNLILTNIETVRQIHHEEDSELHGPAEKQNDQAAEGSTTKISEGDEITALLIKFRSPIGILNIPRSVNENTKLQAAMPVLEINRLFKIIGIGTNALKYVAGAIIFVSGLSMFISLFIRMKDREYEIALLRTYGYSRIALFLTTVSECLVLCSAGFLLGILFSRLILSLINKQAESEFHWSFHLGNIQTGEWYLLLTVMATGIISAAIPAARVFRLNIAKILSDV